MKKVEVLCPSLLRGDYLGTYIIYILHKMVLYISGFGEGWQGEKWEGTTLNYQFLRNIYIITIAT